MAGEQQDEWVRVGGDEPADEWSPVGQHSDEPPPSASARLMDQPSEMLPGDFVPDAFLGRVQRGQSVANIISKFGKGLTEGYGSDTATGFSDDTLNWLVDHGIFHDPAKGYHGPAGVVQFANESLGLPLARGASALMRAANAGVHGAAEALGQLHDELGGDPAAGERLTREGINFGNWAMIEGGFGRFSRPAPGTLVNEAIGTMPAPADFDAAAKLLRSPAAPDNLRDLWEERGIHPAEAAADAQRDAFLRQSLREEPHNPTDRSGIAPAQGSPVAVGTPRSELARTGEDHIDAVLDNPDVRRAIDNPVIDRTHDVPYSAGPAASSESPTVYVDRHFPQSMEVGGVTFDPADAFVVHEQVERHVMDRLIKGGMGDQEAYRVAHFEYAEKAEGAWYRAHEIDQAEAEKAYEPYINRIQREDATNPPPDIYRKPYPHDDVAAARGEPSFEPEPTTAMIERAKAILKEPEESLPLRAVGAAVADEAPPSLAEQPAARPGSLITAAHAAADKLLDIGRDLQRLTTPMAMGTSESRAIAKDFANTMRRNRWDWNRIDSDIAKRFTPEQRKRMWDAADEESVAIQLGESREHQGLVTLEPEERAAVEDLQGRAQAAWLRAVDLGMVEGDGLPAYTPRMVLNVGASSERGGPIPLNGLGTNLRTKTGNMRRRSYVTAEETEEAAKRLVGLRAAMQLKGLDEINAAMADVRIARDIRTLPLATARLEDAIAGRTLINSIKGAGKRTGSDTVVEGGIPAGKSDLKWFTLDHPAFRTWRPKFETAEDGTVRAVKDADGNMIFEQVPIYIRGDFEGQLRAVLSQKSGALYGAMMSLKGKTMSLIMNSPLIHNAVEWGRAMPAMPGKVATFQVYFHGNRARNDVATMHEAINSGMVPIGHRFFNQDVTSIMEEPNLTPGRSWTAKVIGAVPGLFDEGAGTAVRAAIDKAGDFWHNTLLWDRVADLQAGLYVNFRDAMVAKGVDRQIATRAAAHFANRYAGALPQEAMSDGARKVANMLMFSRTFTLGNVGALKDMFTGLPKDVLAQIERDAGFAPGALERAEPGTEGGQAAVQYAKTMARRKAMSVIALDIGMFYVGNSILQSAFNVLLGDSTLDKETRAYVQRGVEALQKVKEHPLTLLQPFGMLGSLSATGDNEPGRGDRVLIGYAKDGTGIYARNPVGKIGEEFMGYMTGPLDMIRRKMGTIARPAWQILSNDKGFGRKIYDPSADTPAQYLRNLGEIAKLMTGSQLPLQQIGAAADLVKGEGDKKVNALQAFGPFFGLTFSKGAPGGPAVGEMYDARARHEFQVNAALPDIRRQILRGDERGARSAMTGLGVPSGLQNWYVKTTLDPRLRLSPRALKDFNLYATPQQKVRMERARPQ